jgi:ferredoxin-type protein NapH
MSDAATTTHLHSLTPASDLHRWLLALVMLLTLAFGWKWPVLGYTVPVAMAAGVGGAFSRGRYVCGNICPRGSFYDTFFRLIGGSRPIPSFLTGMGFRWGVGGFMITLMTLQIARNPGDPMHWGWVFWLVCALTTSVGVLLGVIYRPRTWCSFCPIGTMGNAIGGGKDQLRIAASCRSCGVCEKSCPMDLTIATHKAEGVLPHRDCVKCSSCVSACKVGALSFPEG